ncbi:pyridoxal-dependent decarboxylase [Winogradskyella maritima]|uniref:Pyridoxal phosphate-dependent decarboxylase family protein n=1 Tax=Winogradskyella maritima TaxID=1517766 RepID=A0ABV8AK83_9FLAO|nr:pyridoxal-dependent decarboxylase [Winogradskyella maritima]
MRHTTSEKSLHFATQLLHDHELTPKDKQIGLSNRSLQTLEAFFPGTKAENTPEMLHLMTMALQGFMENRQSYFPEDPGYIDEAVKQSEGFKATMAHLEDEYKLLVEQLKGSGTFFSMRSVGHMLWDTAIPGTLGYFAALLYNQNNVAAEASPVTTLMEMYVGNELCKMLGFNVKPIGLSNTDSTTTNQDTETPTAWGHITCDGSVANLEALWMARNLKFYAVSVRAALQNLEIFKHVENLKVTLLDGTEADLISLDDWSVLNLPIDEVLSIPDKILQADPNNLSVTSIADAINKYSIQTLGCHQLLAEFLPDIKHYPASFCSSTRHYSWPKGAAILGLGAKHMRSIYVDEKARMELNELKTHLDECLATKTPVMNVVAIIGSTEESAVDPLSDILELREHYRLKGMEFAVHADAAWGGYFRTMLLESHDDNVSHTHFNVMDESQRALLPMSDYVAKQYIALAKSDSITIDPHKSGYIPYPAGGLCYRNSAMRNLVAFTAPVVYHGGVDPTVGVYGVEGSKPGAAASAVYFSHRTIAPNKDGYGELSGRCFFNAKRFYAALVCLNIEENLPFCVTPLIPIPAIQNRESEAEIKTQYLFIRDRIVNVSNEQLMKDTEAFNLFKILGGDQTIITYMYNFREGHPYAGNLSKINALNDAVYKAFSFRQNPGETEHVPDIVVTSSSFTTGDYGDKFMSNLLSQLKVNNKNLSDASVSFIISTIMNPWLSDTVDGSFIPTLMGVISSSLTTIANDLTSQQHSS